jgi:uncharacterized GH25 family protein
MHSFKLALALLLVPQVSLAHELWLEKAGEAFVLRYGHRGREATPIEVSKLKSVRCSDGKATRDVLASAAFTPKGVELAASCAAVSAFYYGGFFSLTPDGEKNLPKTKVEKAVRSWESKKFAKFVDARSEAAFAELGDELEIVPARDVGRVRAGDKIALRVLLAGKPARGAVVAYGDKPIGETDSAGETRIRLRTGGFQEISATLRRAIRTPEADEQVLQASLCFEVRK